MKKDKIQIWVCSFGGCGTNMLLDHLEKHGFVVRSESYKKHGIHYPHPIHIENVKAIYLYGHVQNSILSQHERGILSQNLRKANNYKDGAHEYCKNFSDLDITPFVNQFNAWVKHSNIEMPILRLRYESLWEEWEKVESFLQVEMEAPAKIKRKRHYTINSRVLRAAIKPLQDIVERFNNLPIDESE